MFSGSVRLVSNTHLFARACAAGRQVLVYSMVMDADADLAMILPLPVERGIDETDVNFIDLSPYADFFEDLEKAVNIWQDCRSLEAPQAARPKPPLLVRNVGSFEASFAPTLADMGRLDSRFRLEPEVWQKLPIYEDFGFAVFKLRAGLKCIHPMAFEFPRRDPKSLFFPTVHVHDGQSVPPLADFDHELFFQSAWYPRLEQDWFTSSIPVASCMRQTSLPPGLMEPKQPCYSIQIRGRHPNRDTYLVEDQDGRLTKAP